MGLAALAVLAQGLWAGLFLEHDGEAGRREQLDRRARAGRRPRDPARGARHRLGASWKPPPPLLPRDLWVGSLVLVVLLGLESYLGGAIRDAGKDTLTAVHVPLAMLLMGLAVWLPVRARSGRR